MKKQPPIIIDSETGIRLGLTSDLFEDAFCWDCRPAYLGFVRLRPRTEQTAVALTKFFEAVQKIHSEVRIVAPLPDVEEYALKHGFKKYYEVTGSPYVSDGEIKTARQQ